MSSSALAALEARPPGEGELGEGFWSGGRAASSPAPQGEGRDWVYGLRSPDCPSDATLQAEAALIWPLCSLQDTRAASSHTSLSNTLCSHPPASSWPRVAVALLEELNNHSGTLTKWETSLLPALTHCLFKAPSPEGQSG